MTDAERQNSFDLVRLCAALCVYYSHQVAFYGEKEPALGPLGISLASTGLYIFFALSGYLVYKSLMRDPRPTRYVRARILRIFPGAIVNVGFCVVLGAVVTTSSLGSYLTSPQTFSYALYNASIVIPPTQFSLPGVLENARWPVVNGSIWTLKYELLCYVLIFSLYWLAQILKIRWLLLLGCFAGAATALYLYRISHYPNPEGLEFFSGYNWFNTLRFAMTFLAGAFIAATEPHDERTRFGLLAIPATLIVFGPSPEFARAGVILLLTLFVIEIGRRKIFYSQIYSRIGDLSYGTFLYAYPVQNYVITNYFDGNNHATMLIVTLVLTLICALLSWHLVERPALKLKQLSTRPRPTS